MEYLNLGNIVDSFGIDGTVKIYSTTSFGEKRYMTGSKVFLYNPQTKEYKELAWKYYSADNAWNDISKVLMER